jgi:endonuclease G
MWQHLNDADGAARSSILSAIPSVGRINLPSSVAVPYAGTGFVVGENLLMTNRHVAELFADGVGQDAVGLRPGASVNIDFRAEHDRPDGTLLEIEGVRMIHPYWDMALLEVSGLPQDVVPLQLSQHTPEDLRGQEIAVVGYPAFDPRNDREVQHRLFNRIYNVKRLHPGVIGRSARVGSYGNLVRAACHDASTLGGNSGSAVVCLETGQVVALHFAGITKKSNFAVPTSELARDPYVTSSAVQFAGQTPNPLRNPWRRDWDRTIKEHAAPTPATPHAASAPVGAVPEPQVSRFGTSELVLNVPIRLTVGFAAEGDQTTAPQPADDNTEKLVEPIHDKDYADRDGYDPYFLGLPVPIPYPVNTADLSRTQSGETELRYHNFSLFMNAKRRLAQVTACMVDASQDAKQPEPGYVYSRRMLNGFTGKYDREKWFLDPRIPAAHQLPDVFYNQDRAAFDKGHLVRRYAVAFGDSFADVQLANGDTFHSTNCAPQVKGFNRASLDGLWGKLENDVMAAAQTERCVVFSGPVFSDQDRAFHGRDLDGDTVVRIPARYWKMIVTRDGNDLRTHAYIFDQDLSDVDFEFAGAGDWVNHEIDPLELERELGNVAFPHLVRDAGDKMTAAEWTKLVENPDTTEEEIAEISLILPGEAAFDFRVVPNPAYVDLPEGAPDTENAMAIGNDLARGRRATYFHARTALGNTQPVLVSEMDSWGQFPVLIRETIDHLNKDYRVWSVGAAGDTAQNMVRGPIRPGGTEYMLALNDRRQDVKGFVFSAAGNDIIGEDPATGQPVLTDLIRPFNGGTSDIAGHINFTLLEDRLDFLRGVYREVISTIRADVDFVDLPIFIHGYDYPFPYPWRNDPRNPIHAAKDKWLGRPFSARNIHDPDLRRNILKLFIDRLYAMLSEFSQDPQVSKVWLVDCRGALPNVSDWADEIHGTSAGFRKVAKRFKACIQDAGI